MDPLLDGLPVLGTACHVVHIPNPAAHQFDSYQGVSGMTSLFGGSRGRTFEVTGVFAETSLPGVIADENLLLTYVDGIARVFTDTQGRSWPNVIFAGEYQPDPAGPHITDFGWILPFRCILRGLS